MSVICVRVVWDRSAPFSMPGLPGRWHDLHFGPEPGCPAGRRGLALTSAWEAYATGTRATGLLMLDGDMAIDPRDVSLMLGYIDADPDQVWTAPYRIWPASTGRPHWTWAHWPGGPHDASQRLETEKIAWCGLGFTYLPRALIQDCQAAGLRHWRFPSVDTKICQRAAALHIPIGVADQCEPKHLNF